MRRLLFLGTICLLVIFNGFCQSPAADSLKVLLPGSTGQKRIEILQGLVINLWLNHPDTARQYAQEAMRLAETSGDIRAQAIAVRIMGGVLLYQGTYDSALYCSKRSYSLSLLSNDSTLISSALNNIGFTYYHLGSYSEALENLLRSLGMKKKIRQNYGLGQTLNNVGLVYAKLKDYTTAREYFNEAIDVSVRLKDNNIKLYSSNNIGFTHLEEGNLPTAEKYFKESLEIAKTVNNVNWHATAYSGLAQTYYRMELMSEARKQFKISLALRHRIGDRNGISEIYYYLSKMYAASRQLDSAFINIRISQSIVNQTKAKERMLENFELYADLYTRKKKYDSALYFQSKFIEQRDKLFNENLARNLMDIQLKVQEEETREQLATKDALLQRSALRTNFFITVAILTFIFAVIVYRYYKIQKRLGLDLARKNQEVLSQNEEIESQKEALVVGNAELEKAHEVIKLQITELAALNNKLKDTVDIRTKELELTNHELIIANLELDNFIYKSSHDIRGPLARLRGICNVALLDVQDEKAREYIMMLNKTAKHVNDIFDSLKVISDINNLVVTNEPIDFTKILEKVRGDLQSFEGYNQIEFIIDVDNDIDFYSDEFLIGTILHNMIENAVKFQRKSPQDYKFIRIAIRKKKAGIKISFVDNGIGIKEADLDHIFKMFSKAALEHQGIGLGLYTVKQCINKLSGTIKLVRNQEKLTEFEMQLPYRMVFSHA